MKPIEKIQQREMLEPLEEFATDVLVGLGSPQKFLPSKYFYDKTGSRLFEQICDLDEYYPTRTEAGILQANSSQIVNLLNRDDKGISIIELGSGSSIKTRILLDQFLTTNKRICYFPIDISQEILHDTTHQLRSQFPDLGVFGIPSDYESGIEQVNNMITENSAMIPNRKLILFLGSSIGNFEPKQSISFLGSLRLKIAQGQDLLLVGFDLRKDEKVLDAAYNDKPGITAKFNLNLLSRINRELGGDFELDKFSHMACYNKLHHRIEMHIVSRNDQNVHVDAIGRSFVFRKGESIHTENSYKYSARQIRDIARQSGFAVKRIFMDPNKWFAVALLAPDRRVAI